MGVLADPESGAAMGLQRRPMRIYSLAEEVDTKAPGMWFTEHVENFSVLANGQLLPNVKSGIAFDAVALNPPKYLDYLFQSVQKLGAKIVRAELSPSKGFAAAVGRAVALASSAQGAESEKTVVVNCTGIGARALCGDDNVYPIRGQTILVRLSPAPPEEEVHIIMHPATSADQGVTYIVPRPGTDTFILGGTKTDDDWSAVPDEEISKGIIERCKGAWEYLAREDVAIEVLSTQVGLRPGRKGGARVEKDSVSIEEGGQTRRQDVVHQYGHSGAGYQNSIGSANKVLGLVKEILDGA
jgi:glycine/D-amino acid oxidase-like deaminating enzyme